MKFFLIAVMLTTLILASFVADFYVPQATASYIGSTTTATLYSVADSYVNASSPNTNYGDEQHLYVNASSADLSQDMVYVNFDFSSIPQNAYIISAKLELQLSGFSNLYYGIMGGGDSIGAYYCSDNSWAELGITWNNRPTFNDTPTRSAGFGMFIYYTYKSWDVTEDVTKSLPLGALTEVLKFSSKNDGYGHAEFQSKEATNKPKLEIEYTTEPVFEVQFESAQDAEATPYFPTLDSNLGFISFANETFLIPEVFDVADGSYPVEYDSGYNFVRWETTGGITVSDNNAKSTIATISGNGTLKAVGNAETLEYYHDRFLANETFCICGTSNYPYRGYSWNGTNWDRNYNNLMIRATVLNNISPETDETPPEIGLPSQNPPSYDVKDGEEVKVSVDVEDIESGVKNVTLSYTINNGDYWENRPMNYNTSTGLYEATIPGQEDGTLVEFRIDAYNNAGIKATRDETEQYSTYQVIPEFSTFGILLLLIVATVTIIVYRKKHCSHLLKNAR